MNKSIKKIILRIFGVCLLVLISVIIFMYADSCVWVLTIDNNTSPLSIAPYENNLGLMVDAAELTEMFSFDYEFDSKNKSFVITHDLYDKIIFMHNATVFYKHKNIYECEPCFYVENGVPMIEIGFFCSVFDAAYEKIGRNIIITRDELTY